MKRWFYNIETFNLGLIYNGGFGLFYDYKKAFSKTFKLQTKEEQNRLKKLKPIKTLLI